MSAWTYQLTPTSYKQDVENMAEYLMEQLAALGVTAEKRPIGKHTLEGQEVDLPPVIIGQLGNDPKKVSSCPYLSRYLLGPHCPSS